MTIKEVKYREVCKAVGVSHTEWTNVCKELLHKYNLPSPVSPDRGDEVDRFWEAIARAYLLGVIRGSGIDLSKYFGEEVHL